MCLLPITATLLLAPCGASLALDPASEPVPEWLWASGETAPGTVVYLRHSVELERSPRTAVLRAAVAGRASFFVNGQLAARVEGHERPTSIELSRHFRAGRNVLAVEAESGDGGAAAVAARIDIVLPRFVQTWVLSDTSWRASTVAPGGWQRPDFDDSAWPRAFSHGRVDRPGQPWGDGGLGVAATTAVDIDVPDGFEVELVRWARQGEGSWISLTFDPRGRITIGVENGGALRVTLDGGGRVTRVEPIENFPGEARGLLYAHDSLYANVTDYRGGRHGLYRLRDTDGDDHLDDIRWLREIRGGAGHGRNGLRRGPDGAIYVICGDSTRFPGPVAADSPHSHRGDGILPDRPHHQPGGTPQSDRIGPGGYVARTDAGGERWQIFAAGLRNPYDIDFDEDGELFTFDADMEPDAGAPWYRPTCIYHIVCGGEYGWRTGTGAWPRYFPDVLPPVVDIGLSSPTGVVFGTRARFPEKFRRALFVGDWSYGRVMAVHLSPRGASYTGTFEDFITGRPLNVTDLEIGPDGAMYLTTGGRGTQSGLYRVRYSGELERPAAATGEPAARRQRRRLEASYLREDPDSLDAAWRHLADEDPFLRFAARLVVEHRSRRDWRRRALAERGLDGATAALLALTRTADPSDLPVLFDRLDGLDLSAASTGQMVAVLRLYQLALIETRQLDAGRRSALVRRLSALYPASSDAANRELCRLLVYLGAPSVVPTTMRLLREASSREQQMHYAWLLRHVAEGWTTELHRQYFEWFNTTPQWTGGARLHQHLGELRRQALAHLSAGERTALHDVLEDHFRSVPFGPPHERPLVRQWQVGDIAPLLDRKVTPQSLDNGRAVYITSGCAACHRIGDLGRAVGPDLTSLPRRFSRRDMLEHIIDPSKAIDDKFRAQIITTTDGRTVVGVVGSEDDRSIGLITDLYAPDQIVRVPRKIIRSRSPSPVSSMPAGLLDTFNQQQIMDLLAFLRLAGDPASRTARR